MEDKVAKTKKNEGTSHWLILILLALAQFMVVLDVSIVNVMLPRVQSHFHMTTTSLQWVVTAYTLAFGGFLLLGGRAADLYGRRKVFLYGVAAFSIISLLDGLSTSSGMLISLRALQGLAAAFMSPAALSIVLVTYREGHDRNVALSVWGAVASGGAAVGVLLGGILTEYLGWRWNFFINVPVGLFVLFFAMRIVPKHEAEEKDNSLDLLGAASITTALITFVYAIVKAPAHGWTATSTLTYFAISLALIAVFIINESRVKHPLVPLKVFKVGNITPANIIQLFIAAGLFSVFFFVSLYLQNILGYSPVKTGLCFLIIPFAIGISATNAPKLIKKFGYKKVLMVAPLISAVGLLMLAQVPVSGGYFAHLMPGMIVMGLGLGATFVSILGASTSGLPGNLSGLASGLVNTSQQIGGSLGLAIITGIVTSVTIRFIKNLGHVPSKLNSAEASVHSMHVGLYVSAGFSIAAAIVAALLLKQFKAKKGEESAAIAI